MTLRLGSRGSDLAMHQAGLVVEALREVEPGADVEIVEVTTKGDLDRRRLDVIEGRGIFVRELDLRVADGELDGAVHSLKDVPTELVEDVTLVCHLARGPRGDALVTRHDGFEALPDGARIGTSSPRRKAQLLRARPDLDVVDLRGNVDTRVRKARDELDGAVLARAGLERLGLEDYVPLEEERFPPAPGQGIVSATARRGTEAADRLGALGDPDAALMARIERQIIATLGVGCHTPLGVLVDLDGPVEILAELLALDGSETVRKTARTSRDEAVGEAEELAGELADDASHLLSA